ncbi:hypothetical protein NQZ68_007233 [Dissostichus eleginoides]|nr:hypothetical protein NQZ68_007233 [Dissostichus eleginoides]
MDSATAASGSGSTSTEAVQSQATVEDEEAAKSASDSQEDVIVVVQLQLVVVRSQDLVCQFFSPALSTSLPPHRTRWRPLYPLLLLLLLDQFKKVSCSKADVV